MNRNGISKADGSIEQERYAAGDMDGQG